MGSGSSKERAARARVNAGFLASTKIKKLGTGGSAERMFHDVSRAGLR